MAKPRNWYTYEFKRGNKVLHKGITQDLDRRESEHQTILTPKGTSSRLVAQKQKKVPVNGKWTKVVLRKRGKDSFFKKD